MTCKWAYRNQYYNLILFSEDCYNKISSPIYSPYSATWILLPSGDICISTPCIWQRFDYNRHNTAHYRASSWILPNSLGKLVLRTQCLAVTQETQTAYESFTWSRNEAYGLQPWLSLSKQLATLKVVSSPQSRCPSPCCGERDDLFPQACQNCNISWEYSKIVVWSH